MLAGVLPTLAALLIAAVFMIERLQVDWAAFFADSKGAGPLRGLVAWLPFMVAFGICHVAGMAWVHSAGTNWNKSARAAWRSALFTAVHAVPAFGTYVLLLGLASGFIVGMTGIGLLVVPLVAPSAAGWAFGAVLGSAAAPPWRTLSRANWKRLLFNYGTGSAGAAIIIFCMQTLVDGESLNLLGRDKPWVNATAALLAVAIGCCIIWCAALQAYWAAGAVSLNRDVWIGVGATVVFALALAAPVSLMVYDDITVLNPSKYKAIAEFVHSGRPMLSKPIRIGDLEYVGQRAAVVHHVSPTAVSDPKSDGRDTVMLIRAKQWSPHGRPAEIKIRKVRRKEDVAVECATPVRRIESCKTQKQRLPDGFTFEIATQKSVKMPFGEMSMVEFSTDAPGAAVTYYLYGKAKRDRQYVLTDPVWSKENCLLKLDDMPAQGLTVETSILCSDDWPAEAMRIKALVGQWFVVR